MKKLLLMPEPEPEPDPVAEEVEEPAEHDHKQMLRDAEADAFAKAKPVFDEFCSACHLQGERNATQKKLDAFDMTSYPFTGEHAGEMAAEIREVLGIGGGKATMPKNKPGAVQGEDLEAIAAWADTFDASHEGGAHEGIPGHEHHGTH
jgi:hypothetical protein